MRASTALLAAALALVSSEGGRPSAADDLAGLLAGLAPASHPEGRVSVRGWVERGTGGTELVVRVEPQGAAKLVAEPGVTVTPSTHAGLVWPAGPATREATDTTYFDGPVELRLPFSTHDPQPVEARVDYAYCLVGYQCLFGQAIVTAAACGPAGRGAAPVC